MMKNPIKMDDLGVPLYLETPIYFRGKSLTITIHFSMKVDARLFGFLNDLEGSSQNCHSWESKGPFPPPKK